MNEWESKESGRKEEQYKTSFCLIVKKKKFNQQEQLYISLL